MSTSSVHCFVSKVRTLGFFHILNVSVMTIFYLSKRAMHDGYPSNRERNSPKITKTMQKSKGRPVQIEASTTRSTQENSPPNSALCDVMATTVARIRNLGASSKKPQQCNATTFSPLPQSPESVVRRWANTVHSLYGARGSDSL